MRQSLVNWLGDLWDLHFEEIVNVAEASGGKTGVAFDIDIDVAGPQTLLRGTLNFKRVQKFADSRERQFGEPDPDQLKIDFDADLDPVPVVISGAPDEMVEEKPKRGRKKKAELN